MGFVLPSRDGCDDQDSRLGSSERQADLLEQEVQLRVKQSLDNLRNTALEQARIDGENAVRSAVAALETQLKQAVEALSSAMTQLAAPLAQKEQDLAELVLDMAFQLARHIAGGNGSHSEETLLALVSGLLNEARPECKSAQKLEVYLNPADIAFIQQKVADPDIHFAADTSLTPGSAVVELTPRTGDLLDKAEWDARLESRFEAVRAALLPVSQDSEA